MTSAEIRQRFLNFFKERDHQVLPSSSLIPFDDPTLLFTSAGMVQFKPYFLGQKTPPYPRAVTVQKVFRTVDIEVVGHDGHHLTFFEMLGNFSFGDYFKEKAIPYAYEFLTRELQLDPERLWAGIHEEDDESFDIWVRTGIPPERIRRFGDQYNFWAAGPTGPCGPDSEIHYDWGEEYGCGRPDCGPNCEDCDRFLEIWNLVFMQWDRDESGTRRPLKRKGIDTGMGLNRITQVVSGKRSVFETDMFTPLIAHFEHLAAKSYGSSPEVDVSLRVLADHSRGASMLVADGVVPSNEGRGYVLRRLIRRAMVHARRLGTGEGLSSAVPVVEELLGEAYPELTQKSRQIAQTLRAEEDRFAIALRAGMERLQGLLDQGRLTPEEVFYLHDTLGFPIELTRELAAERGITVDMAAVAALMQGQRERSRGAGGAFQGPVAKTATRFIGYDGLAADTVISELFEVSGTPDQADVFLEETPFYAERGGQTADAGWLTWSGGEGEVLDVQAQGEAIRHRVRIKGRRPGEREPVHAEVDRPRRMAVARHHSATHLLHRALRQVLGEEATQAGSAVLPEHATFDFRFPRALTPQELDRVGTLLNDKIREDLPRRVEEMPLQEAVRSGAVALFDEKYGERVRVVSFGDWARELCGGTHVERSGQIGLALLSSDRSIGTGIRRIEMRAGEAAYRQVRMEEGVLHRLAEALKGTPLELPGKVETLQGELKRLEKEAATLKQRLATGGAARVDEAEVSGVKILLQVVDPDERDLKVYFDHLLQRAPKGGVALVVGGQRYAVKVGGLNGRLQANDVIQAFRQVVGGKGGGRGPVGEGGGIDPQRVAEGFRSIQALVLQRLGGA
ncbi:MAG TPA: alanine--tRNA ligase [Candidatus Limnocylindrales bacterium]|nr:alanine--tRNA ligase [Candidatus Limnocylindrales bacterium]